MTFKEPIREPSYAIVTESTTQTEMTKAVVDHFRNPLMVSEVVVDASMTGDVDEYQGLKYGCEQREVVADGTK
jgi:hypothetical protein